MQTINKGRFYKYNNYDGAEQVFEKLANILILDIVGMCGDDMSKNIYIEPYCLINISLALSHVLYTPSYDAKTELRMRFDFPELKKRFKIYSGLIDIIKKIEEIIK